MIRNIDVSLNECALSSHNLPSGGQICLSWDVDELECVEVCWMSDQFEFLWLI